MVSQIKNIFFFILFSSFLPTSLLARNLVIKSLGHSSFLINSAEKSILINPFKAIGCASNLKEPKEIKADFILASSRLPDEGYNPNNQLMFVVNILFLNHYFFNYVVDFLKSFILFNFSNFSKIFSHCWNS